MKKLVKQRIECRIEADVRLALKGSNGDREIRKQLLLKGFKVDKMIYQQVDYKNLEIVYWQEIEKEIEDFETIDYNRYEYYLNEVLKLYILFKPETSNGFEDIYKAFESFYKYYPT